MSVYYKATRPDGTDFYTGTVDYAAHLRTGGTLPLLTSETYRCATATVYHASDVPSETLLGGTWPCRLFEVEGEPVAKMGHRLGFRTLRVIREIEAWKALGPNGREVAAFIEKVHRMTDDDVRRLHSTPLSTAWKNAAWENAAWAATRGAARGAAQVVAREAAWGTAWSTAWSTAWGTAWARVRGALLALVVRDLISEKNFDALYGPWKEVME